MTVRIYEQNELLWERGQGGGMACRSYAEDGRQAALITDATPAAQGSHVATRGATFEIARQYLENPMLDGYPAFDVILGGGKEDFDADVRPDRRDLVEERSSARKDMPSLTAQAS